MSGSRRTMSSNPGSYARSNGTSAIGESLWHNRFTSSASSRMLMSRVWPTLYTCPAAPACCTSAIIAPTASSTQVNERRCEPSPYTVIGSPASACCTKRGTTMP